MGSFGNFTFLRGIGGDDFFAVVKSVTAVSADEVFRRLTDFPWLPVSISPFLLLFRCCYSMRVKCSSSWAAA
jgi:hypothetical protein